MAKVKYGIVSGTPRYSVRPITVAASQELPALSGRYIMRDDDVSSGNAVIAPSGCLHLEGYCDMVLAAQASTIQLPIVENIGEVVVEMPAYKDGARVTLTDANIQHLIGEVCDINVVNGVQYADIGLSTTKVLQIVGGSARDNVLYVVANPMPENSRDAADIA